MAKLYPLCNSLCVSECFSSLSPAYNQETLFPASSLLSLSHYYHPYEPHSFELQSLLFFSLGEIVFIKGRKKKKKSQHLVLCPHSNLERASYM